MAATRPLRIALVGERDDAVTAHRAIPLALGHAAPPLRQWEASTTGRLLLRR